MGSAKEPEHLQLLGRDAAIEDGSLCGPHNAHCGAGECTMRNGCTPQLSGQGSSVEAPATNKLPSPEPVAGGRALSLKGTSAGAGPMEKGEEGTTVAVSFLGQNGAQSSGPAALPDGSAVLPSPPAAEGEVVVGSEALSPRLLPEPGLRGPSKDPAGAPLALKHIAFLEPAPRGPQPDGAGAAVVSPELGPTPPTCPQDRRQEQAWASQGDRVHWSKEASGTARLSDGTGGIPCGSAGGRAPTSLAESQAQLGSPAAPERGSKGTMELPSPLEGATESALNATGREAPSGPGARLDAEAIPSGSFSAPFSFQKAGPAGSMDGRPEAHSTASHDIKEHSKSGERQVAPMEARGGTGPHQSTAEGSPIQEQQRVKGTEAGGEEAVRASRTVDLPSKTCSFEVTPPQDAGTQDAGTQVGTRVSLVSVAISPINPPDGSTAFTFHGRGQGPSGLKSPGPELKPAKKDAEMQVSIPVETRSVATGPMTPLTKSPEASYPEVHVKGVQEEPPEPIREVSWDEKGMTWEVYGASVEVEVLGMAIQKHLEKQIEEHGRQTVMTPQSTRASSIKGAPRTGEVKRPPSTFRALLQSVRRPRCCSRAGPATE